MADLRRLEELDKIVKKAKEEAELDEVTKNAKTAALTESDKIVLEENKGKGRQNFCAEINKTLGINNDLAIYCKENGNMVLLDPSGAIANNSVNQEDLVIYATLVARVKNKSLLINKPDEVKTQINFVKGKTVSPGGSPSESTPEDGPIHGFLSTNWTDMGSVDSQRGEDLETFGMTNIDINFNSGFMPIITIDFVDIRGATLFEQGSCSPYGGFFHQPYPVFELTIKGFYGQPVTYYLACSKFTTSFDAGTGNYKSRGEFLGYSYAFLSDILLGYVMAAPYIEGADGILSKIYSDYLRDYEELGLNQGKNKFNPKTNKDGRPFTVFNYVKKIQSLLGDANSDKGAIAEIQNSTELGSIDDLDNLSNMLNDLDTFVGDFSEEWEELGGKVVDNIYTYGTPSGGNNTNEDTTKEAGDLYDTYFSDAGILGAIVDLFNENKALLNSSVSELNKTDFILTNDVNSLMRLDLNKFKLEINDKRGQVVKDLNTNREEFKRLANEKIKSAIGFIPTIRSFFTVLLANTELFLELLKKVSEDAEAYHENNENDTFNYVCEDNVRVGGADGAVWAWPTYMEEKSNGSEDGIAQVETFPGNNPKYANWPEVKFVEEFLKALQEMQKDITQEISDDDPSIDAYDDIPGRDNYMPINSMETPAGASDCNNGYYNINDIESVNKTLGERFIILSNATSPNSNNINTSIIANAKNKYTEIWNTQPLDTIARYPLTFDGLTYLNNGTITPFFSAGAPFNPTKWGGLDKTITDSYTYNLDKYKSISGVLGYPYVDWASIKAGSTPRPYGITGSDTWPSVPLIRTGADKYGDIINTMDSGGEIESLNNTSLTTLVSSVGNRVTYYKASTQEVLVNSPCSTTISSNGDTDIFVILEPIIYTKKIIYMWGGLEEAIARDTQIAQIPQEIKDKYFIVVAAGTNQSKQNSLAELKSAFTTLYGKDEYQRFLKIAEIDVNIASEINNFTSSYLGYSAGGYALFNNDLSGSDVIGLIDPSISNTQAKLTNGQRWTESSRMVWGSKGMTSPNMFGTKNYETLQSTIIQSGGKSEKIPSLNHLQAVKIWFDKYGSELLQNVSSIKETLVNKILNEEPEKEEVVPVQVVEKDVNKKPKSTSHFAINNGVIMSEAQQTNWENIGRVEAHNFYNSVTNTKVVGSVITTFDNVSEIYDAVIGSLNIDEKDVYKDPYTELYRYNKPLTLNRVSRKNGGPVTILPDIHEMQGSDLVRLNLIEKATELGAKIEDWKIFSTWKEKVSGRKGFGLKKDSTFIKSNSMKTYLEQFYGVYPTGEGGVEGFGVGKKERPRIMQFDGGKANVNFGNVTDKGSINSGTAWGEYGTIWEGSLNFIDNSYTELGLPTKSRFSNVNVDILDKFLTVDIFPDFEFYYKGWNNIFIHHSTSLDPKNTPKSSNGTADNAGVSDFVYKYARSFYEFNNDEVTRIRYGSLSAGNPLSRYAPYRSWHTLDFASMPLVHEYSEDILNIGGGSAGFGGSSYNGFGAVIHDDKQKVEALSYSTSYDDKINLTQDYKLLTIVEQDGDITDFTATDFEVVVGDNVIVNTNTNDDFPPLAYTLAGTPIGSGTSGGDDPEDDPPTSEPDPALDPDNSSQLVPLKTDVYYTGFGVQSSVTGVASGFLNTGIADASLGGTASPTVVNEETGRDGNNNANFLNVGGSLTETPFWRHNFPAKELVDLSENDSNVNKSYYSFYGGGWMNIADSIDYKNPGIANKQLYMGLKNDLDSYNESSKFFPGGLSRGDDWDYYYGPTTDNGKRTRVKLMLTNHNRGTAKQTRDIQFNTTIDYNAETNYNRTKAWKGSLAYLFLANQFHRPWTGLYNSAIKNLGPQGMLGLGSTTTKIPKHSVLLLGSVLWRMREAGLLESSDSKWNMEPQITNGTDPVCYPVVPDKIKMETEVYDTRNFIKESSDGSAPDIPSNVVTWPTNHGVRPPQISLVTNINQNGGDPSMLCFPRADEWPAPNTGMVYAYDFFEDKGVTNPFKNQYKIWTPVMSHHNTNLLRYKNQQILWTTGESQAKDLVKKIQTLTEGEIASTANNYSDSAKESIATELGGFAQAHLEKELENVDFPSVETRLNVNGKKIAGSDEGYTRFTAVAHHISRSFTITGLVGATGPTAYSKKLSAENSHIEDGRGTLGIPEASGSGLGSGLSSNSSPSTLSDVDSLTSEYLTNNSIDVELKTFDEIDALLKGKYTKEDGTVLTVKTIVGEVPYDEGESTYVLEYYKEPGKFTTVRDGSGNKIPNYDPNNSFQVSLAASDGPDKYKKNINTKLLSTNIQGTDTNFYNGNWTSYYPQTKEGNGGYTSKNGHKYTTNAFQSTRYFGADNDTDRSKEAQKRISEANPGLGIDTNSNNVYRYMGRWSQDGSMFYGFNGSAKIGRKFKIIALEEKPAGSTTGSGNPGTTPSEQFYNELFKDVGYLRGYIPLGPELWFMPTSVKNIFIKEFEEFVGDFNNFNESSDFDEILKIIDPLNFPAPAKTSTIAGVFEDEITYPNMFAEFGQVGTDAPYMLRVVSNNDIATYGSAVDSDGVTNVPEPLIRWLRFYSYGTGLKSAQVGNDINGTEIPVREQKTILPFKAAEGGGSTIATEAESYQIWSKLFDSYYIMASTTPRTWWGEFPLEKDSNGQLKETVNDYFRFGKQEMWAFLKGFAEELNSPAIYQDYKQRIKDKYSSSLSSEALGGNQDDDIRLTLYRSLKSIYDKWISASSAGGSDGGGRKLFFNPIGDDGRTLIDHFSFVNRVNQDIGDRALVDLDVLTDLFSNTRNSIYGVTSDVLDHSNFNFFALPSYVDLSAGVSLFSEKNAQTHKHQAIADMFSPMSTQERFSDIVMKAGGPHFLCQYVGGNSQKLNLSVNKERGCLSENTKRHGRLENNGDSFSLDPDSGDCHQKAPPDISTPVESSKGVIGFKVKFGSDTQSHFLGVNLDQAEHKNTLESLKAIDMIANSGTDGGSSGFVAKGQSLYEIFLNRSYTCTVEALGNAMIQPLQYFELENVPMFYGSYLIRDVKHNIRPHTMRTTFTGERIPYAVVPVVEDIISSFSIKPTQSGNRVSLAGGNNNSGGGTCYEDQTKTITVTAGTNYIIGDSKTPWLKKASTNTKVSIFGDAGGESSLWQSGKGVNWLKQAVNIFGVDDSVQSIIINIGANDNYNLSADFSGLVDAIKSKFPNAKLYVVQGAYNYKGSNKNKTIDDVKAYYAKFKELGVVIIEPPVGDGATFMKDGVATTDNVHQQLDVYNTIMEKVNELVPEPTGEKTTRVITERVEVPCKNSGRGGLGVNVGNPSTKAIKEAEGLYVLTGDQVHIVDKDDGLTAPDKSLRKMMADYNKYVKTAHPDKDWEFGFNGVTRNLAATRKGGKNRSTTSIHGAGIAIDVQFLGTFKQSNGSTLELGDYYDKTDRPGAKRYAYSDGNFTAVQDEEFVRSIYNFLTTTEPYKSEMEWGAEFLGYCKTPSNCREISGLPAVPGKVRTANKIAVNEMHHFQWNSKRQAEYWVPWEKTLKKLGLPYPPLVSKDRAKVYSWPFENNYTETTLGELQGDGVGNYAALDGQTNTEYNGEGSKAGDYGVSDYELFLYMAWQQGSGGSAQHYSLWKRNGKKTKYTIPKKNITANWPAGMVAKNGTKKGDIDNLYDSNQPKLAEAFVDIIRQVYGKRKTQGLALLDSDGSNRSGVPYSEIKAAFTKHASGPECTYESLASFGTIENLLNTDTKKGKTFVTMFQMNSTSGGYDDVINKLSKKDSSFSSDYEEWENIDVLTAAAIPKMKAAFASFKNGSGFV